MANCYIVQKLESAFRNGTGRASSVADYNFWWTSGQGYNTYTVTIPDVPGIQKVVWEGNFFFDKGDYRYQSACSCVIQKDGVTIAQGVNSVELNVSGGDVLTVIISIDAVMLTPPSGTTGTSSMSITYDSLRFITTVALPSISDMQYASEVNTLAKILNVSTTSAGTEIVKSVMTNIGNAIGNMTTAWDNDTKATAVTFSSSEATKSEVNSCITNMTGNYAQRTTIPRS